ncbi:PREDICTED: uncharacterized protein LOC108569036 [Nicrophorus vespilloides]|uniref:Uncharacterized protein LOC108569036 n=1 Tax=Nicrophorus vespilloides TaxID=110193 RepID=A0ABM1NGG1_NICVS|nr:PREDICTED: uncharacterized protein LOC108569036 [Nicrophorus vespilloides]
MSRSIFYGFVFAAAVVVISIKANPIPEQNTNDPQLTGKMFGGSMGMGSPHSFHQFHPQMQQMPYNPSMMGSFNPVYGGYSGHPGSSGMHPSIGGNGYVPNYLQQYDIIYSKSRKVQ